MTVGATSTGLTVAKAGCQPHTVISCAGRQSDVQFVSLYLAGCR